VQRTAIHPEGPWWDVRTDQLWWVDILGMTIHRSDFANGNDVLWSLPEHIGAVVGRSSGGAVALLRSGFAAISETGHWAWLAKPEAGDDTTRFNDGKCDPSGRLVGGTLSYKRTPGAGSLFRLEKDHSVKRLMTGLTLSNGLAWSEDGGTLYLIDSGDRTLTSYEYSDNAVQPLGRWTLGPGIPDGMTIDRDGFLWVAMYGSGVVQRLTPDGEPDLQVVLPVTGVTSCAFGGPDLDVLYITTSSYSLSENEKRLQPAAGGIFACASGSRGKPEPLFAG
jgi:sugar lactone lactonase YvrE